MKNMITTSVIFVALAFFSTVAGADSSDVKMLKKAKITLVEAITTAERHKGGKAFEAEIDDKNSNPEFEVKVLKDQKVFEVTVDGLSGKVTQVKEK